MFYYDFLRFFLLKNTCNINSLVIYPLFFLLVIIFDKVYAPVKIKVFNK